jgi:hypothetical protein
MGPEIGTCIGIDASVVWMSSSVESDDAAMARFRGGLNREIQDILDYKDYFDITTLFEYACKA